LPSGCNQYLAFKKEKNMNLAFKPIIESFSDAANGNPFGYEPLWRKLEAFMDNKPSTGGNWPPYNLIQEDGKCVYQFAIAGFKKEDIRVELDRVNSFLSIVGSKKSGKDDSRKYLHKGIAEREFHKKIFMTEDFAVEKVTVEDGILSVVLKENKKEIEKPILIPIE
jgi:molecular chaperone IbpA